MKFKVIYIDKGKKKETTVEITPDPHNPNANRHHAFQAFYKAGKTFDKVDKINPVSD